MGFSVLCLLIIKFISETKCGCKSIGKFTDILLLENLIGSSPAAGLKQWFDESFTYFRKKFFEFDIKPCQIWTKKDKKLGEILPLYKIFATIEFFQLALCQILLQEMKFFGMFKN